MKKGFSLLEMIIVIAVIGIIIGVTAVAGVRMVNSSKKKTLQTSIQTIVSALQVYKQLNGDYPKTEQEFKDFLLNKNHHYFNSCPVNPFYPDKEHPENGWYWDPNTLSVYPVTSSNGGGS